MQTPLSSGPACVRVFVKDAQSSICGGEFLRTRTTGQAKRAKLTPSLCSSSKFSSLLELRYGGHHSVPYVRSWHVYKASCSGLISRLSPCLDSELRLARGLTAHADRVAWQSPPKPFEHNTLRQRLFFNPGHGFAHTYCLSEFQQLRACVPLRTSPAPFT